MSALIPSRGQIYKNAYQALANYPDKGKWIVVLNADAEHVTGVRLTRTEKAKYPSVIEFSGTAAAATDVIVMNTSDLRDKEIIDVRLGSADLERVIEVLRAVMGVGPVAEKLYTGKFGDERAKDSPYPVFEQWDVIDIPEGHGAPAGLHAVISTTEFNRRYFRAQLVMVPVMLEPSGPRQRRRGVRLSSLSDAELSAIAVPEPRMLSWCYYLDPCSLRYWKTKGGKLKVRKVKVHEDRLTNPFGKNSGTAFPDTPVHSPKVRGLCIVCKQLGPTPSPWPTRYGRVGEADRPRVLAAVQSWINGDEIP